MHHCSWRCFPPRLTNAKPKLNTKARKTQPKQKMKHPRFQAWESPSTAMQVCKITDSKKQKLLGDILKNASKCRCEPQPPYHKLWPLIQISDLQSKTKNPKNSKPSPQLQTSFAIKDLGLQSRFAHALFYRKQTNFHCKPKPLVANPLLHLRIRNPRISHVSSAANHKQIITNRNPQLQPTILIWNQILTCNPKSLNATQNP